MSRICNGNAKIVVVLLFCFTAQAVAQNKTVDLTEMSLEDLMNVEIYGASKFLQKASEAPASISVVTAEEIARFGYRTLADALGSASGFYVTNDRNYSYIGVRGFSRPGDYNSRILLLVNGHRLNDNIYDSVLAGNESPIDIDLIERIEIIRGPSSSLYGTSAFFGVVNIITKTGGNWNGVDGSVDARSFDTYKGRIGYGAKLKNGLEFLVAGTVLDSAGQSKLFFPEFDDPSTNNGIAENADRESNRNVFASFSFGNWSAHAIYGSRKKTIPTASYETVFNTTRSFTIDSRSSFGVKYEKIFKNNFELVSRLSYDRYRYDGDFLYDYSETDEPFLVVNRDYGFGDWMGAEAQLSKKLWNRHRVTVGLEYRYNFHQDQDNFDVDPETFYLNDRRSSDVWALFIQDEYSIAKDLILSAGLRYDSYDSFGGTANPRFGLIYGAEKPTTVKVLYGQAFRAPNTYELFYEGGTAISNPQLKPETIKTTEVVIERLLGQKIRFSGSGYYYRIKDLISQEAIPDTELIHFENADKVNAKGVTLKLEARELYGFQGHISYTLQETRDAATGLFLSNSPRHMVKLSVIAPLIREKVFAGFESRYVGKRLSVSGESIGGSVLSNLTFSSSPKLLKAFQLSAGIFNLFDKRYGDPGTEDHRMQAIEQDGRSFRVKLTFRIPGKG